MKNDVQESIASIKLRNALFKVLEEQGISQRKFSRQANVADSMLSMFLNGKRRISLDVAEKLVNHLGYEFVIVRKKNEKTK